MNFYSYFFAKSLSIFFLLMGVLTLTATILLPLLYETTLISSAKDKSKLNINNIDLWANIPGRLNASLSNKFSFFNLDAISSNSDVNISLLNSSISLDEQIAYDNFNFDAKTDQVQFKTNSIYKLKIENDNKNENISLSHINQGLLEALTTLTNPPEYQQGLNSINILLNKVFVTPEDFIKKLFTVFSFDYLINDRAKVLNTILRNFPENKAAEIYDSNKDYSIGSISGLFEWIQLLGDDDKIKTSVWPKKVFNLSISEITSIVGKESYLYSLSFWYNNNLSFKFNCKSNIQCGPEIIFRQLNDASVTNSLGYANIKELSDRIDPKLYPYDISPEFINFYNLKNNLTSPNTNNAAEFRDDISFDDKQLFELFYETNTTLLDTANIIDLLFYYQTGDLYSAYTKFTFKSKKQLNFFASYIFDYLVEIFLHPVLITNEGLNTTLSPLSAGFTSFLQIAVDRSYPKLFKNIKVNLISKILDRKILNLEKTQTFCHDLLIRALNKTEDYIVEICNKKELNMTNYRSLKIWMLPYDCVINNVTDCRVEETNNLKKLSNLTDEEIYQIYNTNILTNILSEINSIIQSTYQCGECTSDYLAKAQWLESKITNSPPKIIQTDAAYSMSKWDSDEYPTPFELGNFMLTNKCTNDCSNSLNLNVVLSLYNTVNNYTSTTNREAYYNKLQLQKAHSLFYKGLLNSTVFDGLQINNPSKYFSALQSFIWNTLIGKKMTTNYKNLASLLQGGQNDDDDYFLNILRSGNFYENFRPKKNFVTGFNIDIILDNNTNNGNKKVNSDFYSMHTGYPENEYNVRKIESINNYEIFNTNSKVYSPIQDDYIEKNIPLFNNFLFNNSFYLSDGFQFASDRSEIYYYDPLSSRVLEFKYSSVRDFTKSLACNKYVLSDNLSLNLKEIRDKSKLDYEHEIATAYEKFSKPFIISKLNLFKNANITKYFPVVNMVDEFKENMNSNFICVDKYSDMVLEFNITLMYSIYTGNLNRIIGKLPENAIIPLYAYSRTYSVDPVAYDDTFPGIIKFQFTRLASLIIGLVLCLIFFIISTCLCIRYRSGKSITMNNEHLISSAY